MERALTPSEHRTFDLEIPCTCAAPAFCERYHGLPMSPTELVALLPGNQARIERMRRLFAAYDEAPDGDSRVDAFRALTWPFNSY